MPKKTELPELPEPTLSHVYLSDGAYTADQMREYALAALAAVKGEGEAAAQWWGLRVKGTSRLAETCDTKVEAERLAEFAGRGEQLYDIVPLYLHPRAEPSDGEMLAFVLEHGLPSKCEQADGSFRYFVGLHPFDPRLPSETPLDAIRAAMKERDGS